MHDSNPARRVLATLFGRPDEVMLELGASGELQVARARALLSLLALGLPLAAGLGAGDTGRTLLGLGIAVFVNLMAQIWLALARGHRRLHWLPYATGTYDISVVTAVLALQAMIDAPASLNGVGVWCFYLFAIALTALRHDGRLALYLGSLAIFQYALLVASVLALGPAPLLSLDHGAVTVGGQATRLAMIALMTLLTAALVYRMQRLIEMSGRDSLTGVPNRAWLMQRLPRMFEAARREGRTVTIGLVDMDHFKRVYEELGQIGGDRAIRHLVGHLREMLGEDEHLARIGGQEFVLVLRCPIGSAWERIDRYRRSLAERPFQTERGNEPVALTFSAGLAAFPQDGGSASALLGAADRRLQEAQRCGRNRVIARDG